jgi:hypothetical protein
LVPVTATTVSGYGPKKLRCELREQTPWLRVGQMRNVRTGALGPSNDRHGAALDAWR